MAHFIYRGAGNILSSYWVDVFSQKDYVASCVLPGEFCQCHSSYGHYAQSRGVTVPNLRIIFRGEPGKEIFTYRFNLLLPKWKNKEEMMTEMSNCSPKPARSREASHPDLSCPLRTGRQWLTVVR